MKNILPTLLLLSPLAFLTVHSQSQTIEKKPNVIYNKIGNTTYGSDGSVQTEIGNHVFDNEGNSSVQIGDHTYNSDG